MVPCIGKWKQLDNTFSDSVNSLNVDDVASDVVSTCADADDDPSFALKRAAGPRRAVAETRLFARSKMPFLSVIDKVE